MERPDDEFLVSGRLCPFLHSRGLGLGENGSFPCCCFSLWQQSKGNELPGLHPWKVRGQSPSDFCNTPWIQMVIWHITKMSSCDHCPRMHIFDFKMDGEMDLSKIKDSLISKQHTILLSNIILLDKDDQDRSVVNIFGCHIYQLKDGWPLLTDVS